MGNALRKAKGGPVDGGQLRTSTPQVIEYDVNAVAKMIQSRRLAPFYEGLPDAQTADNTSYDSLDSTNDSLGLTGDTSLGSTRNSSPRLTKKKKSLFRKTRQKNDSNYEQQCLSHFLRNRSIECPICFLVWQYASVS